ncbi:MAG: T9SS type A sorting domain-containing protein [Bacteroidales bacterium]|nr:T9SS type A sorting domain-containing protein [Bacteroidales bacterium]MBN2750899.1 T9SS type A sorting domain-containing protein [Bacteroidales bacterium]
MKHKSTWLSWGVIPLALALISWGNSGHYAISENAEKSFNAEMQQFYSWTSVLANHASDADYRKGSDPTEGPKHYIDLDYYAEFNSGGGIPENMADAIARYGSYDVYDWGILPWATLASYDSLVSTLRRGEYQKASLYAADLGHYVGDGHMPMHLTKNYNGQLTGNTGIHSRYESTMINYYVGSIQYSGREVSQVDNVSRYVFSYLYDNFKYKDSVLIADNYAKSVSSNTSSTAYKSALWQKSKGFTKVLFENASHALAQLIYTAWIEAGRPSFTSVDMVDEEPQIVVSQNVPNPFSVSTQVAFTVDKPTAVSAKVFNANGQLVDILLNSQTMFGHNTLTWNPSGASSGVYILVVSTSTTSIAKKMVLYN